MYKDMSIEILQGLKENYTEVYICNVSFLFDFELLQKMSFQMIISNAFLKLWPII